MPRWRKLLITGAAGEIGSVIRPALRDTAAEVVLHDLRGITDRAPNETALAGDIVTTAREAMAGVECVIHLAGIPREAGGTPAEILRVNVVGTHAVFDAAREAGVQRMIFASSNHTIGFHPADRVIGTQEPPRPSGFYGASKVYGEALGRLHADKFGMAVACLRIGAFRAKPGNARELGGWISHGDMQRLARACVLAAGFHFLVLYGVSANTRGKWGHDAEARAKIGYVPQDDAEVFAREIEAIVPAAGSVAARFHGGTVCETGFTGDPRRIKPVESA